MAKEPFHRPSSASGTMRMAADALGVRTPRRAAPPRARPRVELITNGAGPAEAAGGRLRLEPAGRTTRRKAAGAVPGRNAAGISRRGDAAGTGLRLDAPERRSRAVARRRLAAGLTAAVAVAAACGAIAGIVASPFGDDAPAEASRPATTSSWSRLAKDRSQLRDQLAAAQTPQDQAAAAARLADVYDEAARTTPRGPLKAAASGAAAAYVQLAEAAQGNDSVGYTEAAGVVDRAERRLALAASQH
jgi:hypothetical protein